MECNKENLIEPGSGSPTSSKNITSRFILSRTKRQRIKSDELRGHFIDISQVLALTKSVISIKSLREIWTAAHGNMNLYYLLLTINSGLTNNGRLSEFNVISPTGLEIILFSASFRKSYMNIMFEFEEDFRVKLPFELFVFIFFPRQNLILPATYSLNEKGYNGFYDPFLKIPFPEISRLIKEEPYPVVYIAISGFDRKSKLTWTRTSAVRAEDHKDVWGEGILKDIKSWAIKADSKQEMLKKMTS